MRLPWAGLALGLLAGSACAYTVEVGDADPLRQSCSGMWSGPGTAIEITFSAPGPATVASIVYEYNDFAKLGKAGPEKDFLDQPLQTYICTAKAVTQGLCKAEQQGDFLVQGDSTDGTSIVKTRVQLDGKSDQNTTYAVTKTGFYCVGAAAVPLVTAGSSESAFTARIHFRNSFKGELPAGEWPKLQFYFTLTCLYILLGAAWGYLCVKHRDDLLMVQHFISALMTLLLVASALQWLYYRYLNTHVMDFWRIASLDGKASVTSTARFLLVLTSILDATKTSASLAILLCVSMGLSVVRPSIGPVMRRVQLLTAVHFVCGVLYSIGIVMILIDTGGAWIFIFIFPLAFTLSSFLMWTLHALNATIEHLAARKQAYKKIMFTKLYRILLGAVVAIFAFFVITSVAFTQAGGETSATAWPYRWVLLDGWLGTVYFIVFAAIAWVWRPTGSNARLSMSDELAQDDDLDAEDFEIDEFGPHHEREPDEEEGRARPPGGAGAAPPASNSRTGVSDGATMFALEGSDDEEEATPRSAPRSAHMRQAQSEGLDGRAGEGERQGLMQLGDESRETLVPPAYERGAADKRAD